MTGAEASISERALELAGAATLGGACAFAAGSMLAEHGLASGAPVAAAAAVGGSLSFWAAYRTLRRVADADRLPIAAFDPVAIPDPGALAEDELLLDQPLHPPAPESGSDEGTEVGVLELADVLGKLPPDSRVVRLFDVAAIPTAGQLQARIQRHLKGDSPEPAAPDASEALHQALAELRRSLR